jgi:uncharacterized protein (TIRG00374 family)
VTISKKFRALIPAMQAIVSIALLAVLLSRPGFRTTLTTVVFSADPRWLAAGFFLAGAAQIFALVRWRIFLKIAGLDTSAAESTGIFFAGLFCNLFLPGGAGGDVVKIGLLAARGHDPARAAISVIMDHFAGSISMVVLGSSLMAWKYSWLTSSPVVAELVHGIAFFLVAISLVILATFALSAPRIVSSLPASWPGRGKLIELSGVYFQCAIQWRRTLFAQFVSGGMLMLLFLSYYFSARAYGIDPGLGRFFALMPTIEMISGLPVSLGGVGVRETVFVLLLGSLLGTPEPTAVAISLAGYTMTVLWGIPGAFLWLLRRKK